MRLAGDRTKLWYQQVAPYRRGAPDWPGLPLVEDRAELRALRGAVGDAAAKGAITRAQAMRWCASFNTVMGMM